MGALYFLGTGLFFASVLYSAAYRGSKQKITDKAILHVAFTGLGCVFGAVGSVMIWWGMRVGVMVGDVQVVGDGMWWWVETGAGWLFAGMGAVALPIWVYLPSIARQPTEEDMAVAVAEVRRELEGRIEELEGELARVRGERKGKALGKKEVLGVMIQERLSKLGGDVKGLDWAEDDAAAAK